mmetsp:Transcript_88198/g.274431  ORF Transcript_88198/g.274431 Transcript_88198/m.274431 type:complete len:236 (-) Transcript_88198:118-825(-)
MGTPCPGAGPPRPPALAACWPAAAAAAERAAGCPAGAAVAAATNAARPPGCGPLQGCASPPGPLPPQAAARRPPHPRRCHQPNRRQGCPRLSPGIRRRSQQPGRNPRCRAPQGRRWPAAGARWAPASAAPGEPAVRKARAPRPMAGVGAAAAPAAADAVAPGPATAPRPAAMWAQWPRRPGRLRRSWPRQPACPPPARHASACPRWGRKRRGSPRPRLQTRTQSPQHPRTAGAAA